MKLFTFKVVWYILTKHGHKCDILSFTFQTCFFCCFFYQLVDLFIELLIHRWVVWLILIYCNLGLKLVFSWFILLRETKGRRAIRMRGGGLKGQAIKEKITYFNPFFYLFPWYRIKIFYQKLSKSVSGYLTIRVVKVSFFAVFLINSLK